MLCPLVLVGMKTIGARLVTPGSQLQQWLEFIGHPFTAILLACLIVIYGTAKPRGMSNEQTLAICSAAVQPAGIILLMTGAGGCSNRSGGFRRRAGAG